jgi:ubiquinone/menaquinone biosynthesis C-methylase UbiE
LPVSDRLHFSLQDYSHTAFANGTFSKVFGIESICHANDKLEFLTDAYRLLKPGGKIGIVDFFSKAEELSASSRKLYAGFLDGWVIPNLATCDQFTQLLGRAGFAEVTYRDMTQYVWPSIERIDRITLLGYPLYLVKVALGLIREDLAGRYQKQLFRRGIITYGAFVAVKPGQ